MCLALYKPKGVELPPKHYLTNAWSHNDDGIGYMLVKQNLCHIFKGFLTFNSFYKHFKSQKVTKNDELVIHFRFGTSGPNSSELTHPFPITDDLGKMKALRVVTSHALVHNGVLGMGEKDISDTMVFIRDGLAPVVSLLHDKRVLRAIEGLTIGNRLLIVSKGKVMMTGNWIIDNGIYFSNDGFRTIWQTPKGKAGARYDSSWGYDSSDSGFVYREGYGYIAAPKTVEPRFIFDEKNDRFIEETTPAADRGAVALDTYTSGYENIYCPSCGTWGEVIAYLNSETGMEHTCRACGADFDYYLAKKGVV